MLLREGCERSGMAEGQGDIIEAAEQAVAAERIDREALLQAECIADRIFFERDREGVAVPALRLQQQLLNLLFGQRDQQNAILPGVRVEDIGEGGRKNGAEAKLAERPGSVLARGAAAEVFARSQNLRTPTRRSRCARCA
jgi:hypothetical protein